MKNATHITIVLDESGSMDHLRDDVVGSFNSFIKEQQDIDGECMLTLVQFRERDSERVVIDNANIHTVSKLNKNTYRPSGGTPLLDAVGHAIQRTGQYLSSLNENQRPDKVVFVVITDGEENQSSRFSRIRIKEMVEHQTSVYNWSFIYLGANVNAFAEAGGIGISYACGYNSTSAGLSANLNKLSSKVGLYRSSNIKTNLDYSAQDQEELTNIK